MWGHLYFLQAGWPQESWPVYLVAENFRRENPLGSGRGGIAVHVLASKVTQHPFHPHLVCTNKPGASIDDWMSRSPCRNAGEVELVLGLQLGNLPHRQMKPKVPYVLRVCYWCVYSCHVCCWHGCHCASVNWALGKASLQTSSRRLYITISPSKGWARLTWLTSDAHVLVWEKPYIVNIWFSVFNRCRRICNSHQPQRLTA